MNKFTKKEAQNKICPLTFNNPSPHILKLGGRCLTFDCMAFTPAGTETRYNEVKEKLETHSVYSCAMCKND